MQENAENVRMTENRTEGGNGLEASNADGFDAGGSADGGAAALGESGFSGEVSFSGKASSSGETASRNEELQHRAEELAMQAELLQRATGFDMMALFQTDEAMRNKVVAGEWDFVDAYAAHRDEKKPPQLARGGSVGGMGMNVAAMNGGQFERLNEMLAQGGCVRF